MVLSGVLTVSGFSEASEYDNLEPRYKKLVNVAFYKPCSEALESENAGEVLVMVMSLNDRETTLSYEGFCAHFLEKFTV
nr:hypothetical protein [Endozoicomonas sp.]